MLAGPLLPPCAPLSALPKLRKRPAPLTALSASPATVENDSLAAA